MLFLFAYLFSWLWVLGIFSYVYQPFGASSLGKCGFVSVHFLIGLFVFLLLNN
jgi:hypothetical protein